MANNLRFQWDRLKFYFYRTFKFHAALSRPQRVPVYTIQERAVLLSSLKDYPAFKYLCIGLNNYRANFQKELLQLTSDYNFKGTPEEFRKLARLQESIYWTGWMESYIERATRAAIFETAQAEEASQFDSPFYPNTSAQPHVH